MILSVALTALWFLGLWYASPAIVGREGGTAARWAGVLLLGIGIPLIAGFTALLYAPVLWLLLIGTIAVRVRRWGFVSTSQPFAPRAWEMIPFVACLTALAWPAVGHGLTNGLSYHLPNAMAWVDNHSVWVNSTRFWWYPGGSELFATGLLSIGGSTVVGWAGLAPAILLGLRFRDLARDRSMPMLGIAIACCLLATRIVAVQLASLQNDLWLAALFVEGAISLRAGVVAFSALIKPYGVIFDGLSALVRGNVAQWRTRDWALIAGMPLLWLVRDLFLAHRAAIPFEGPSFDTSIAAHLPSSFGVLVSANASLGVVWCIFLIVALAVIVVAPAPWVRWLAIASAALCFVLPFDLNNALPFVTIGAAALCFIEGPWALFVTFAALAGVIDGVAYVWRANYTPATIHEVILAVVIASIATFAAVAFPHRLLALVIPSVGRRP